MVVLVLSTVAVLTTAAHAISMLNIVGVFVLIVYLLWTYDSSVKRRQRIFMKTGMDSSANTSLLEALVQERTQEITEANTLLKDANRKLAAASAAQLQTFACMSHEIRTPLNCIIALSNLLQESQVTPKQSESLQLITSSSDLLLAVVNDVLDYSKLESGKMDVQTKSESLQLILDSTVFAMEAKAREKDVSLVTKYDPNVNPFMTTDGVKLQQCLYNIVGNAIKFSTPGSPVELRISLAQPTQPREDESVHFYSPTDDSEEQYSAKFGNKESLIRFSITNQGEGIAKEDMKKIFQPFRQSATGQSAKGTGLGLAITSKLIHAMGGRLSVESEEGKFATFTAEFPSTGPFDVDGLTENLSETVIALVCPNKGLIARMNAFWDTYGLECLQFDSLDALKQEIKDGKLNAKHTLCLVGERVYDETVFQAIQKLSRRRNSRRSKITLMTMGTSRVLTFEKTHVRCLTRLLPTVLLEILSSQVPVQRPTSVFKRCTSCEIHSDTQSYRIYRVLVADDNGINQKVMVRMLNRIGIQNVDIADNGQQAVDLEASKKYDVILMDVEMPVIDGIKACELIKLRHSRDRRSVQPKIIFVTGHAADEFGEVCRKAGAIGFVSKPFKLKDVKTCFEGVHEAMLSADKLEGGTLSRSESGDSEGRSVRRRELSSSSGRSPSLIISSSSLPLF